MALGGTFDILHIGHLELLKKSFELGDFVVIGLTSDEFVKNKLKKKIKNPYEIRIQNLKEFIKKEIRLDSYKIITLDDNFGPLMISPDIECLVVSSETEFRGKQINLIRKCMNLPPVDIVSIELILAEDGYPISSTRIRSNEIDTRGFKIKT